MSRKIVAVNIGGIDYQLPSNKPLHIQIDGKVIGEVRYIEKSKMKKQDGNIQFTGYYKDRKSGNALVMFKTEEGNLVLKAKGGVHDTNFTFYRGYERVAASLAINRGLGNKVYKRKNGTYLIYVGKK